MVQPSALIRERDLLETWCRDFEIFAHEPRLQAQLTGFDLATGHSFDRTLYDAWKEEVQRFQAFHAEYPFVVAPPGSLRGEIATGLSQLADAQPLGLHYDEFARHVGIFGMTGAAKTTVDQYALANLHAAGARLHLIDGKRDAEHFVGRDPTMLALTPHTPLPLLDREHLGNEHGRLFIRTLRRTLYGGEGLEQVATEALATTYERYARPTLVDLHRVVLGMERKGDTYTRRDRIAGLALRLARLIDNYPGWSTTPAGEGLDLDLLRTRSWYFGFTVHTELEDFLSTFLIEFLFARKRLLNDRTTQNVVSIDEAVPFFDRPTISGDAALVPTLGLLREFQIACIITANNVRSLPATLKSNLYLQIVLNLSDHAEAAEISKTFGLTHEQQEFLNHKLTRGTAIVRLADRWRKPILATFPPPTFDKHITREEWTVAQQRTDSQARPPLAARKGDDRTGWQPPAHTPTATASRDQPTRATTSSPAKGTTASAPEDRSSPAQRSIAYNHAVSPSSAVQPTSSNAGRRTPLNTRQRDILIFVARVGVATVMETNAALGLQPMQADRERKKLGPQGLGLLTETRITVGSGRGRQATALMVADIAYDTVPGLPRARLGRGSGPQHAWCLRTLRDRIPRAAIEGLGCADVSFVLDPAIHEPFLQALRTTGDADATFVTGSPIALEVELTTKHITANIARNAADNFAITIILAFPADLAKTKRVVQLLSVQHRTLVVDVFRFLDALRSTEGG